MNQCFTTKYITISYKADLKLGQGTMEGIDNGYVERKIKLLFQFSTSRWDPEMTNIAYVLVYLFIFYSPPRTFSPI